MPGLQYIRIDVPVRIEEWPGPAGQPTPDLAALATLLAQQVGAAAPVSNQAGQELIGRIVLDIRGGDLHEFPWEQWFRPIVANLRVGGYVPIGSIVRVSRVPPRVSQATFTPPLRVLLCDVPEAESRLAAIRAVFGPRSPERDARVARAFVGAHASHALIEIGSPPNEWPVVDILQLGALPFPTSKDCQLSPSARDRGSLGWLSRLLDSWQTRLLILDAAAHELPLARTLAARIVACGGPAVIVREQGPPADALFERIIHDAPLDEPSVPSALKDCLYGGSGREELVRVSNTADAVMGLADKKVNRLAPNLRRLLSGDEIARREVMHFADQMRGWTYAFRESDGLIPMAAGVEVVRNAAGATLKRLAASARKRPARYVNGSLWGDRPTGRSRVDPRSERLRVAEPYLFCVQIGERDRTIPVYEASMLQEMPKLGDGSGVWVEIAVNGDGFDVEGERVQHLWIPAQGPSDECWFAIRPTRTGAAVLRYTIYYMQNVVQTFRLAALAASDETVASKGVQDEERRLLRRALDVRSGKLRAATWITRLEYAAASIPDSGRLPPRDVSFVVNHINDERVITVKGERYFYDSKPGGVNRRVTGARDTLFATSVVIVQGKSRDQWVYRFGDTATNEYNLREALPKLAAAGWDLYSNVFSRVDRRALEESLAECDKKIAVSHVLLDDVIPWACVYDRPYTDKAPPGGKVDVCLAALPDASGAMRFTKCGQAPDCVLHAGIAENNAACPLRFWGFRHLIEVPPKQAKGNRAAVVTPAPIHAPTTGKPRLRAVVNAALATTAEHVKKLKELTTLGGAPLTWDLIEEAPASVIAALSAGDIDVAYLYCHARGGWGDPDRTDPPVVEFSDNVTTLRYKASEFEWEWARQPLVIVNGCSTAAFTPDGLSEFIQKFSRDCLAGAVIGTEMPVHEVLASQVAYRLLARVLDGQQTGAALLAVRRSLLAEHNPLGLAYTLYGFTEQRVSQ